jgi:hypothetical protein
MKVLLAENVDLFALGAWLEQNVGPVWMYMPPYLTTPQIPENTPVSKGRRWVFDMDFRKNRMTLELDGRKLKPGARVDLLLRFT